jgi:hypothetical protein
MIYNTQRFDNFAVPMLIDRDSRRIAKQFALQQPHRQKAEQVYLNTLAVCVVNDYLQWLGIATERESSDSWNKISRLVSDVADLKLTGLGYLECRPIRANYPTCHIPAEVWQNRLGYAVVQIEDSLKEASILGFLNRVDRQEISLSQLQPIEALLTTIEQVRLRLSQPQNAIALFSTPARLSEWLQGIFTQSWQSLEAIFGNQNIAHNFRNVPDEEGVERAKLIDLEMQFGMQIVVLLVALTPEADSVSIRVRLYPPDGEIYLPHHLKLSLLSADGTCLEEVRSRRHDNYIQLPRFSGEIGEHFSIQVSLENAVIVEDFEI